MNKRIAKLIMSIVLFLEIVCVFNFSYVQAAATVPQESLQESFRAGSGPFSSGDSESSGGSSGKELAKSFTGTDDGTGTGKSIITKVIKPILSAVRIVSVGLGAIIISYLGIRYMMAAPDEKANIKSQLITFTVGAVVVFAAASILSIINNAAATIFNV